MVKEEVKSEPVTSIRDAYWRCFPSTKREHGQSAQRCTTIQLSGVLSLESLEPYSSNQRTGSILIYQLPSLLTQWGLELVFLLFQITENCDSGVTLGIYFQFCKAFWGDHIFLHPLLPLPWIAGLGLGIRRGEPLLYSKKEQNLLDFPEVMQHLIQ